MLRLVEVSLQLVLQELVFPELVLQLEELLQGR
jgi:hypothetical protein